MNATTPRASRVAVHAAACLFALVLVAAPAELAAQGGYDPAKNPSCLLVSDQEIDAATGMDYDEGMDVDVLGEGIFGGATCLWGGRSMIPGDDRPQIAVVFIPPGPRGSYTDFWRKRTPETGCTRETLRGVGDVAFAETCDGKLPRAKVYVKAGRNDLFVSLDWLDDKPLSWAPPVVLAVAKAAAPRAKDQ
jgi:hypothetical protein